MLQLIIWALGTGFVTGAVWFGIHFYRRGTPAQAPVSASPFEFAAPPVPPQGEVPELHSGRSPDPQRRAHEPHDHVPREHGTDRG